MLGDTRRDRLAEIWSSPAYAEIRRSVGRSRATRSRSPTHPIALTSATQPTSEEAVSTYRLGLLAIIAMVGSVGCSANQATWTPTVDTYGNSRAQYVSRDLEECRMLAMRTSGHSTEEAVSGAVTGGLVGAAAGAAIGAVFGDAGRGAAVGAAAGGMGNATRRGVASEAQFKRSYENCMRNRGHRVIN